MSLAFIDTVYQFMMICSLSNLNVNYFTILINFVTNFSENFNLKMLTGRKRTLVLLLI